MKEQMVRLPEPTLSPLEMLSAMVRSGVDPEKMAKMVDMHEQWERKAAEKEYGLALSGFQAELKPVCKARHVYNKHDILRYSFANYEDVMKEVAPLLQKFGISVSFQAPTTADAFVLSMRIRVGSHYEDREYAAPMPDLKAMAASMYCTEAQAFLATTSLHKRNCLCLGLNIVVADEDTNCEQEDPPISEAKALSIRALLDDIVKAGIPHDEQKFLAWLKVKSIHDIPLSKFGMAMLELNRKKAGK